MANYGTILSECLQSPFDIERYRKFVVNFLKGTTLKQITSLRSADIFAEYSYYVQGYALVGEYTDPNRKRVGIYAVKLNAGRDIEKARSKQRNFISKLLVDNNFDAAIAAFYLNEESKWRLSFVRLDYEFAKGKAIKNLTPAKRYSYLVGKDEPCHTAQESLLPIFAEENFTPSIDSIEQAFSIERVTKQFFEKYKEKYLELKEYLEHTPCFVEEAKQRGFTSEQFAKKLMGQIVFLYFLQKKGWLGVNAIKKEITEREYKSLLFFNSVTRRFADKIYTKSDDKSYRLNTAELYKLSTTEEEYVAKAIKGSPWGEGPRTFVRSLFIVAKARNGNFFDEYLEPLFYEGLNKKRDADNYYAPLHCRIPFLNGGLFEPLDNYDWENNFFSIPNEMFSNADIKGVREADGILDIFDRYNFTMNEDEPLEKEVAVDPEMLGKIFENLLDVSDRKSKGAFYTPREIVHYMCQESLTNYIVNTVGTPYEDTKDFVVYGEIMKDEDCSRESTYGMCELLMADSIYKNLQAIDNALADVRVADPAVGSGAFPMGMLSEIVKLREIITEYMARNLCLQPQYKGAEKAGALRAAIWKLRNEKRNSYNLKKETMRNSIYAVDIEPSAVDIAKLRLWLTLVVEQEIDPSDPYNDSPVALPNLDCNIMCGNSLIDEFEGINLSFDDVISNETVQTSMLGNSVETDLEKLFKLQRDYFYADNHDDKRDLKQKIEAVKERILSLAFTSASEEKKQRFEVANTMHSTPFFLWKLNFAKVFKEKGGFDIVIGNPPYFNVQTYGAKSPIVSFLMKRYSEIWMDKSDILFYFIYLGYLLTNNQVCYITSNAYLFSDKAKKFRNFIISKLPIKQIENFENYMVFDTASITSCVTHFIKQNTTTDKINAKAKVLKDSKLNLKAVLYNDKLFFNVALSKNSNFALIEEKIQKLDVKIKSNYPLLGNVLKVGKGMETAANNVFLFENKPNFPDQFIKRRVTGEMIEKYLMGEPREYLLYYEDVEKFDCLDPSIQEHLLGHRDFLQARATVKNEGRAWWKYSRPMHKEYYIYDKIWCSYRGSHNSFALDTTKNCIGFTNTVAIFDTNPQLDIRYILALVNSKLLEYQHKNNAKQTGGGIYEYVPNTIERYPIPTIPLVDQEKFIAIIDKILERKAQSFLSDTSKYELEIDKLVYQLYGLTDEEIAIVEEAIK